MASKVRAGLIHVDAADDGHGRAGRLDWSMVGIGMPLVVTGIG